MTAARGVQTALECLALAALGYSLALALRRRRRAHSCALALAPAAAPVARDDSHQSTKAVACHQAPSSNDAQSARKLSPNSTVVTAINTFSHESAVEPDVHARRQLVAQSVQVPLTVPTVLWVAYREWVDQAMVSRVDGPSARAGRAANFHSFVCAHTLSLPHPGGLCPTSMQPWCSYAGTEAADIIACLAKASLLNDDANWSHRYEEDMPGAHQALVAYLERSLLEFDVRVALHDAAKAGNVAQLSALLDAHRCGIDEHLPVQWPPCGETALIVAARAGQVDAVALLLDRRADAEVATCDGWRALHFAAQSRSTADVACLLCSWGANLHARTKLGATPLHLAAFNGRLATTRMLLQRGSDLHARDGRGYTPLQKAVMQAQFLRQGCPCNSAMMIGRSYGAVIAVLERVTSLGNTAEVRTAVSEQWHRLVVGDLTSAVERDDEADLSRLLRCYVDDVNAADDDGETALHAAALTGHVAALRLLLNGGADVHARSRYDDTPLHFAAREGHLAASELLLSHGGTVHAINRFGVSPRAWAIREKNREWEAVSRLLAETTDGASMPLAPPSPPPSPPPPSPSSLLPPLPADDTMHSTAFRMSTSGLWYYPHAKPSSGQSRTRAVIAERRQEGRRLAHEQLSKLHGTSTYKLLIFERMASAGLSRRMQSRSNRCAACWHDARHCICASLCCVRTTLPVRAVVVMHHQEYLRASDDAKLLLTMLPDAQRCLYVWGREGDMSQLHAELAVDPAHTCILWPGEGAKTVDGWIEALPRHSRWHAHLRLRHQQGGAHKAPVGDSGDERATVTRSDTTPAKVSAMCELPMLRVVLLDGVYRHARTMFRHLTKGQDNSGGAAQHAADKVAMESSRLPRSVQGSLPLPPHVALHPRTLSVYSRAKGGYAEASAVDVARSNDPQALRICTVEAFALLLEELGEATTTTEAFVSAVIANNKALAAAGQAPRSDV